VDVGPISKLRALESVAREAARLRGIHPLGRYRARDQNEYFYLGRNRANIPKRAAIDAALLRLAPSIPPHERMAVVDHAIDSTNRLPVDSECGHTTNTASSRHTLVGARSGAGASAGVWAGFGTVSGMSIGVELG